MYCFLDVDDNINPYPSYVNRFVLFFWKYFKDYIVFVVELGSLKDIHYK